jgi:hypothetical protein
MGAQHDVLATAGIDEDVLEARQGSQKDTGIIRRREADLRWKCCRTGLGKPNVMRLQRGKSGVGERSRAPTLPQDPQAPASA